MGPATEPFIRWMCSMDLNQVLEIEADSFEFPWSERDLLRALQQRNTIGMVVEAGRGIAGYMLYELHPKRLHLLNLAVDTSCRRQGVGTSMIRKLVGKLSSDRRKRILLEVRERNLPAQLFFRSHGFKAIDVLSDFYDDTTEDAYLFERKYSAPTPVAPSMFAQFASEHGATK